MKMIIIKDHAATQLSPDPRHRAVRLPRSGEDDIAWSTADFPPGQEIVFIGVRLDHQRVLGLMRSALLTDTELAAGPRRWVDYADPLPPWSFVHTH